MDRSKPKAPGSTPPSVSFKVRRIAAPTKHEERENRTGRVTFDDRGQAVWEWSVETGKFKDAATGDRLKKLEYAGLGLVEQEPVATPVKPNPLGTVKGYDPYDSGRLGKPQKPAKGGKKDLRRLGEWIKLRKQIESKDD